MAQVIKWGALGVALVAVIALAVGLITQLNINGFFGGFGTQVNSTVAEIGSYFQNVRGAINYILGDSLSIDLYNALIWAQLLFTVLLVPVELLVTIHRFINQ